MSMRYKGGFIQEFFDPLTAGPATDATLYAWGLNSNGQLGTINTTSRSSPVQVSSDFGWSTGAAGYQGGVVFIKNNGAMYAWGLNNNGQLGLNDRVKRSSPVQVGSLTTWLNAAATQYSTAAIKTDGTLWTWGENNSGQLGQNVVYTKFSSPVQVGALTNWSSITGTLFSFSAIKTDGTLWSCGSNSNGQLGLNTVYTQNKSSPTQVGTLTNWASASGGAYHVIATKTDGTMWSWGANNFGALGLNISYLLKRSSPSQIGALTTWSKVSASYYGATAIKTDGTLWSWGYNGEGQVGDNTRTNRSSPVQIGTLTTWSSVASNGVDADINTFAIKTDGTLWAWGNNGVGALGDGTIIQRSSPVQIGSSTNWSKIIGGGASTFGIRLT